MDEYIAFDSHKHYTLVEHEDRRTRQTRQHRIEHRPGASGFVPMNRDYAGQVGAQVRCSRCPRPPRFFVRRRPH
ncbi:MAG: hypothetical protein AMK72_04875 [Planctomycetes bacterium SM23_25]|nr:MAG: hypothetical protein AMK72_04875 [Planctomycetes bacterium SM23_25]